LSGLLTGRLYTPGIIPGTFLKYLKAWR